MTCPATMLHASALASQRAAASYTWRDRPYVPPLTPRPAGTSWPAGWPEPDDESDGPASRWGVAETRGRLAVPAGADWEESVRADLINESVWSADPDRAREILEYLASWPDPEPCLRISPPSRGSWTQSCIDYMYGGSWCNTVCLNSQTEKDFEALMAEEFDPDDYYYIAKPPSDPIALDLLAAAWKLVLANLDLMQWAGCWVMRNRSHDRCEVAMFKGEGFGWGDVPGSAFSGLRFEFVTDCDFPYSYQGWWWYYTYGGVIQICMDDHKHFKRMKRIWSGGVSTADRACAVLDLASVLVHEMTHVCGGAHEFRDGLCDLSDLIEMAFLWGLYRRYAFVRDSACCSDMYRGGKPLSKLFGWGGEDDNQVGAKTDCI